MSPEIHHEMPLAHTPTTIIAVGILIVFHVAAVGFWACSLLVASGRKAAVARRDKDSDKMH
jgi:hypothetical protein